MAGTLEVLRRLAERRPAAEVRAPLVQDDDPGVERRKNCFRVVTLGRGAGAPPGTRSRRRVQWGRSTARAAMRSCRGSCQPARRRCAHRSLPATSMSDSRELQAVALTATYILRTRTRPLPPRHHAGSVAAIAAVHPARRWSSRRDSNAVGTSPAERHRRHRQRGSAAVMDHVGCNRRSRRRAAGRDPLAHVGCPISKPLASADR